MGGWMSDAVALNRKRLAKRADEARALGFRWLVECRDMWDAHDDDAGVYFVPCEDEEKVGEVISIRDPDAAMSDKVLGIFDLSGPLSVQNFGVTRAQWLSGERPL